MKKRLRDVATFALVLAGCILTQFAFADGSITVTNSGDAGPGTLRQAIADSVSGDTITFALDDGNIITLTNGQLFITNDLTIISTNATIVIDAGGSSRVLEISTSNIVTLDSLTITNGNVPDNGGGILVDDGATLTLTNCTVAGNSAGAGGGIFFSTNCTAALRNSSFASNSATNNGGAIGIDSGGTLTITNSIFTGNSAVRGGAIFSNFATNTLYNCTFSANSAEEGGAIANLDSVLVAANLNISANFAAAGGGIFNLNNSFLTLNDSTLSSNFATNYGGALINTNGGTATLNNSTISTNSCPKDQGGGIDNWAILTINRCTVANNGPGGGIVNTGGKTACNDSTIVGNYAIFDGGGFYSSPGTNTLNNCTFYGNVSGRRGGGYYADIFSVSFVTNTIVASNTAGTVGPDVFGSIPNANNLTNGNPLLAPLGDYGGPTQTMPPLFGSPAINAGVDSVTNLLANDQRGYARKAGAHVDIGAVEVQPAIVINADDDGPGSLRAVASSAFGLIVFTNTLSGQTIHLTSGQLILSNSVEIDASGLANSILLDAGNNSRVLEITASNLVTLDSLTITNGNVPGDGGGILVDDGATLILKDSTVAGNSAGAGGGIFISTNSTVAIRNSVLSANSAAGTGGGVESHEAFLTIDNCTLDGNNPGGGIALFSGILTANNSTISHNTANQSGGGFAIAGGQAMLNNCTLFGNSGFNGGGMAIDAGVTNQLNNCTITGNSAATGGGIFQDPASISVLVNTIVAGNSATNASEIFGPITGANNLTNGNPLLALLGNYGGQTQTMPPLAGSAAIDAGLDSTALPITDQRGYPRKSGPHADLGAVEAQLAPANNRPILHLSRVQPGNTLIFTFTNIPNADFTVLSSTNLALPRNQWDIFGPATQNLPGSYQFTSQVTTNYKARFYQVVSP
jgi:fibronectin-binding autotransporter adhesin